MYFNAVPLQDDSTSEYNSCWSKRKLLGLGSGVAVWLMTLTLGDKSVRTVKQCSLSNIWFPNPALQIAPKLLESQDLSGIQKRLYFLRPVNLLLNRTHNADLPSPHPPSHSGISDLSVFPDSYTEWLILVLYAAFMSTPGSLHDFWRLSAWGSRTCHSSTPFNMAAFFMVNLIP